jgi:hypothetical protein
MRNWSEVEFGCRWPRSSRPDRKFKNCTLQKNEACRDGQVKKESVEWPWRRRKGAGRVRRVLRIPLASAAPGFCILDCAKRTDYDTSRKEQVMGNRDKRGREKKKPKRKEIKQMSRPTIPARPAPEYKPVTPPTSQTEEGTGE